MHTPKQKRWLTEKFRIFLGHLDRKTLGVFFPALYVEYFALWPPPVPAVVSVEGPRVNPAVMYVSVRKTEEHVCDLNWLGDLHSNHDAISGFTDGCITKPGQRTVSMDRVRVLA